MAKRTGANLFVSIHTNYAESKSAQGFEVYEGPRPPEVRSSTRYRTRPARETISGAPTGRSPV
mgnify:CR=1 FL=1